MGANRRRSSSRTRKLVFAAVTLMLVVITGELLSWVGFLLVAGQAFSYRDLQRQRAAIVQRASVPGMASPEAVRDVGPRLDDITAVREVIHPYLGFVLNPELNEREDRAVRGELAITELGFFQDPGHVGLEPPGEVDVAVFGGSAALLFAFQGRQTLVNRLSAALENGGRGVTVRCWALGGYKQPQQLMELAYLLALGHRFDVVLNIDGFNEIALTYQDNYRQGVCASYPKKWKQRVAALFDPEAQRIVGRVVFLSDRRAEVAKAFSGPLARSVTGNLLWAVLDRWYRSKMAAAELAAADYRPAMSSYAWKGPYIEPASELEFFESQALLWATCSRQMHRLCAANGIRYVHVLQPNQYVPGSKRLTPRERSTAYDSGGSTAHAVTVGYPLLQREGRRLVEQGVRFLDLTMVFQDVEGPLYVDPCCHFNPRGNVILADAVADAIIGELVDQGE